MDFHGEGDAIETEFVRKYGSIPVKYIPMPKVSKWYITKPFPLDYFYKDTLIRTRGIRGTSTLELFFDLLYVGVCVNFASNCVTYASGLSLLKYILLFLPAFQVWTDVKEFMNHYYNEDLSQKLIIIWFMALLTVYGNNAAWVTKSKGNAALTVIPYILCRVSFALILYVYSVFIPQHRLQLLIHATLIFVTCGIWVSVIFVPNRVKVGLAFMNLALEQISMLLAFHRWMVKKMKLTYYAAMNIEHETARFFSFYTICIGQFVAGNIMTNPTGMGLQSHLWRALMILVIGFTLIWFYFNGEGSLKAVHALRRNVHTGYLWMYLHMPLIGSLVLAANTSNFIVKTSVTSTLKYQADLELKNEVPRMYAISFMFTGGICVALISLCLIALLDKPVDHPKIRVIPKPYRILPRIPVAIIILCLSFAEMTTNKILGITMTLLVVLFMYEIRLRVMVEESYKNAFKQPPTEKDRLPSQSTSMETSTSSLEDDDPLNVGHGLG